MVNRRFKKLIIHIEADTMNKDIIIFDDDAGFAFLLSDETEEFGLNPISFTKSSETLKYITGRKEAPLGYLIDMKPYPESEANFLSSPEKFPELPIPEEIFNYVKSRGWTSNFYFMSAHRSPHDDEVLERTGAGFLFKHDKEKSIYRKLETIASEAE